MKARKSKEKKELCRDVVDKRVRLLRDITTVGGRRYAKGTEFVVNSTSRGRFNMSCRGGHLRQIHRSYFEIIGSNA